MHTSAPIRALVAATLALVIGCGKDEAPIVATQLVIAQPASATAQNRVALATQPIIQLANDAGTPAPTAGVVVTATVISTGATVGGTATATTDANGAATFLNLAVHGAATAHEIQFSAPNLASTSAFVTTSPGAATTIAVNAGNSQTATVNTAVATDPSVKVSDADGNGVSGVAVSFFVGSGGGVATGVSQNTNTLGVATVTSWTLGTAAGANTLSASSTGLTGSPVGFSATGTAGAATKLVVSTVPTSTAQNRVPIATQPAVRLQDLHSNNVSQGGVTITASITSGGGTLLGTASAQTDASGIATFTNLAIAGTIGARTLGFTATGLSGTSVNVTTTAGPATNIALNAGNNQTATVSTAVATPPSVIVRDQDGNAVSGITVNWAVTAGGGSLGAPSSVSSASGIATNTWTVGSSPGTNTMTATNALLTGSPVTFTATGSTSTFNIDIVYLGAAPTSAQQNAFTSAVNKWQSIITGDVADANANLGANDCQFGEPAFNGTIDDLRIYVKVEAIDGAGQVLGSAGPCHQRNGSLLPATGTMRFDSADLANLETSGQLETVILHEMGHVLGVGTLWARSPDLPDLIVGSGGVNPYFNGVQANARFDDPSVGGAAYVGSAGVPIENTGGAGTRDGHWREFNFETELMTGFLDAGVANPLSIVTIGSLQDLGYTVSYTPADSYSLFTAATLRASPARKIHLVNDIRDFVPRVLPPEATRPPRRR